MLLRDRARAEADATPGDTGLMLGDTKLMMLQDEARTEADVANRNTSDCCCSARELLEARERELQYFDDTQEGLGVGGLGL